MSKEFNSPHLRRGDDKQQRYLGFFLSLRKGNKDTNKTFKEQNSGDSTKSITTSTLVHQTAMPSSQVGGKIKLTGDSA